MLSTIKEKYPDFCELPNKPNDTSKAYKVKNFKGQIGFITSMTEHFCGSCNRLRITADGNLKVCLFGNKEISLKDAIRSNCSKDDLLALIESAVKRKQKQHAGKKIYIVLFVSNKCNVSMMPFGVGLKHLTFSIKATTITKKKNKLS